MATIKTTYTENLRTVSMHVRSGNELITDAPTDNAGLGQAFSPTDLLATSLGTCMLTIMGIAANNNGYSIDGTAMVITKIMAANPRRVARVEVELNMPANGYTEAQKSQQIRAAENCPVALSLHPDLEQVFTWNWK